MNNHPGQFLRFLLFEEEMPVEAAAEHTGLTAEQISRVVMGTLSVTPEMAAKLAKLRSTTTEMWLDMQKAFDSEQG